MVSRPIAFSTVCKHRRSPFGPDENMRATISGRLTGIVLGLGFSVTVTSTFS